jgi:predicted nucleotidyltransferase
MEVLTDRFRGGRPGLRLLVLFGSRARGEAGPLSDWDFGFIGEPSLDTPSLLAELAEAVDSDDVDLVDLTRANGQLRFRAAADGRVIYESEPEVFRRFWFETVSFWCDMGPILREGYDAVLKRLAS